MSQILWVKVSDEVGIPSVLSPEEETKLASIFNGADPASAWRRALASVGMNMAPAEAPVLRFVAGVPYFNGSLLAWVSSHGTVWPKPATDGGVAYESSLGVLGLFRVLYGQWKVEFFLKAPSGSLAPIEESIALGLAIQSLMQRFPSKSDHDTASWLASPASAPAALRGTLEKVLTLQKRRNSLSKEWAALFRGVSPSSVSQESPAHFWNEPATAPVAPVAFSAFAGGKRKGIPICPGQTEAELFLVEHEKNTQLPPGVPFVLLFPKARPETTELFSSGVAVLFGEGGALSHACSVARESGVICVSGLGKEVVIAARQWQAAGKKVRATVDGSSGEVLFSPEAD